MYWNVSRDCLPHLFNISLTARNESISIKSKNKKELISKLSVFQNDLQKLNFTKKKSVKKKISSKQINLDNVNYEIKDTL